MSFNYFPFLLNMCKKKRVWIIVRGSDEHRQNSVCVTPTLLSFHREGERVSMHLWLDMQHFFLVLISYEGFLAPGARSRSILLRLAAGACDTPRLVALSLTTLCPGAAGCQIPQCRSSSHLACFSIQGCTNLPIARLLGHPYPVWRSGMALMPALGACRWAAGRDFGLSALNACLDSQTKILSAVS